VQAGERQTRRQRERGQEQTREERRDKVREHEDGCRMRMTMKVKLRRFPTLGQTMK
jgi:hypothetical protein